MIRIVVVGVVVAITSLLSACGSGDDFCALAGDGAQAQTLAEFNPDDVSGTLEALRVARDEEARLRSAAPEAVRADLDLIIQYLDDLIAGLEEADPNSDEQPAIYAELRPRNEAISAASGRIQTYVLANCDP